MTTEEAVTALLNARLHVEEGFNLKGWRDILEEALEKHPYRRGLLKQAITGICEESRAFPPVAVVLRYTDRLHTKEVRSRPPETQSYTRRGKIVYREERNTPEYKDYMRDQVGHQFYGRRELATAAELIDRADMRFFKRKLEDQPVAHQD